MSRVFGGVPADECDCDRLLLKLLGDLRKDPRTPFLVIREQVGKDAKGREGLGVFLFGHDLALEWLEGPAMQVLIQEIDDRRAKEKLR